MNRLKLSVIAFAVALTVAAIARFGVSSGYAAEQDTCTPEPCMVRGGPAICCLIGQDAMTCQPCGGVKLPE